ncbi:hypothetical protein CSC17_0289 [Klebsiella oxytoca]|nr:hypothetical protein CSC17_0289 [Klebsiella oxytoca]EUC83907.1 hypothetical protein HMPREF1570_2676 [Klebsiella oxytoca KA-2]
MQCEKYLENTFQWVKKRFPTRLPCLTANEEAKNTKAAGGSNMH